VVKRAFSALGKLGIIIAIAIAFFIGMVSTVYLSLRSPEVKVPDVVGKDVMEGEAALDKDGLNMRRRATRYSPDAKPNTILDQSPHAGEVIKVGQTVAVVISRSTAKEGESPVSAPTSAEENFGTDNQNTSESSSSSSKNENENANKEKANRNTRSKNTNNSNNSNANNSNANRNANNRNANNRNANERNTNDRNANERNVNNRNANANRAPNANGNVRNTNSTRNTGNANSNRRAPVLTTPPFNPRTP
jgi:hypothetical protein